MLLHRIVEMKWNVLFFPDNTVRLRGYMKFALLSTFNSTTSWYIIIQYACSYTHRCISVQKDAYIPLGISQTASHTANSPTAFYSCARYFVYDPIIFWVDFCILHICRVSCLVLSAWRSSGCSYCSPRTLVCWIRALSLRPSRDNMVRVVIKGIFHGSVRQLPQTLQYCIQISNPFNFIFY